MAELTFHDLSFSRSKDDSLRVNFLKIFYFEIPYEEISSLGEFKAKDHEINFPSLSEAKAQKKFAMMLNKGFENLKSSLTGKPAVYIHQNSGISLIGNNAFGIVDRNSTLIEIKPITGCNLKCIYCSVNEDKRDVDFVVEKDYLVEELRNLIEFKDCKGIEIHINSHGEPLFYEPLVELITEISSWDSISAISIDTNGTLLTREKVDKLIAAGLTSFNISINAITKDTAKQIAGCAYDIERIKDICKYIVSKKKAKLLIAPVFMHGINDEELEKLALFAKSLDAKIGIQNFLSYKYGRNPVKEYDMEDFFEMLRSIEEKHEIKLIMDATDFCIKDTKKLPKPFRKGDIIKAKIMTQGRFRWEKIAVAKDRNISIRSRKEQGEIKIKITRDKHNIFFGSEL